MDTNTQTFLSWLAPPPKRPRRGVLWYLISVSLGIALLVQSIWSGNWLFAALLVGIAIYYGLEDRWALKRDRTVTLTEHGIIIDEKETTYDEWRRAWFQQRGGLFELHLEKKTGLQRHETLPLAIGIHPEAIAEILADRVPFEINHRETFLDSITHILKI